MRILIVEDDKYFVESLKKKLESETFAVDTSDDGEKGSYLARVNEYDIVLLNKTVPRKNGIDICREIRGANKQMPIIVFSMAFDLPEKIALLQHGADDYLTKPVCFDELLAHIQALLRRPPIKHQPVLSVHNIKLDCYLQQVTKGEKRIYLTRKEFALLEYMLRNKGVVLSRGMIMEHVWDNSTDPFSNTIESHILNLRKKLDSSRKKLIRNVPGRGYKIDVLG